MNFRVGPFVYRVKPVAGYIEHEGEPCLGLADHERHEILISDQASAAQQIQVVCHEYMEAWVYHFGKKVADKEGWCDLFGLAMTQFITDMMATLRIEGKDLFDEQEQAATGDDVSAMEVSEQIVPAVPGASRPWRVRVFEPIRPDRPA